MSPKRLQRKEEDEEEGEIVFQVSEEMRDPAVLKGIGSLGIGLYKLLAKENANLLFSPFAISAVLAMLLSGSEGETAEEIGKVLGYKVPNIMDEKSKLFFRKLLNAVDSNPYFYTFHCANAVLSDKVLSVKEEFKSLLEAPFEALFKEADFRNEAEAAIKSVNEWVNNKTNGTIPELLNSLDPSTVMTILNGVYFKGVWSQPFDEERTVPLYFCNRGDKEEFKHVDMMHARAVFSSMEGESFQALELPIKAWDLSMLILLPNSKDGLSELENSLSIAFLRDKVRLELGMINVALPKFKLECSMSLKETLRSLGLSRVFNRGAHLNGISDSDELFIHDVSHKATLEVDETGRGDAGVPPAHMLKEGKKSFIADHPFMFLIYHTENYLIHFMGRVNKL